MSKIGIKFIFTGLYLFNYILAQEVIKMMVVIENTDRHIFHLMNNILPEAEKAAGGNDIVKVDVEKVELDRNNVTESLNQACAVLSRGIAIALDMTHTGWDKLREIIANNSIIYLRSDGSIIPFIQATDEFLKKKNATDFALIFENPLDVDPALYYLLGASTLRLVIIDNLNNASISKIHDMKPQPSYYMIYSSTKGMEKLFQAAVDGNLVTRSGVWNLVFTDMDYKQFRYIKGPDILNHNIGIFSMNSTVCCTPLEKIICECPPDFKIFDQYLQVLMKQLVATFVKINSENGPKVRSIKGQCPLVERPAEEDKIIEIFKDAIIEVTEADPLHPLEYMPKSSIVVHECLIDIEILENGTLNLLAEWTKDTIAPAAGQVIAASQPHFRIGTTASIPWVTLHTDPRTGEVLRDANNNLMAEGYCIDFIRELSKKMQFTYELVVPKDRKFGDKLPDGQWTGLVGDLATRRTDIAIASLTMTSEREEVIDFVAPYFEQSGILIVMRKPVKETSLFKFMTVLKYQVWLSIVGAIVATAIMIWILDKYSPYSASNNKQLYPYPCREFTLKESFWFALTSFTPQGGGEAPKALSSRVLVAAYWLFVVLMLATFTANLAAFLTVERMQVPVQSLEQLARQSKINYTVVNNSNAYQYFSNMKNAEDKLYKVWKEITLNSTSDQTEYRVWDYPIKEQYGHIFQTIKTVGTVANASEGFLKVLDSTKAEFAFIHDSAEIQYQVTKDCNLTEIGEIFAEQPYAVAVQQGSHLQEEISRAILDLQKDRFFENLSAKYWNTSLKDKCPTSNENEGITLESLGGVFIATLFGLALAMITLGIEVLYHRRKNNLNDDKAQEANKSVKKIPSKLIKPKLHQFKPAPTVAFIGRNRGLRSRVSHISVYPKTFPYKD
ncbi:ionotropic receptor 25a [Microplitis demolitor]|uniref:ionotropic receptor 25a n=1 Tax=Microplitis demolitor TaxID=69319 RepID=UPI00235B65DE|nr:ionotropic receptor 25a [Microplitis demolitor]